ncbi:hypothetical protein PM082_012574 [Marasmius tenuissimus]|nr:hypothetical protein PM082_012574 [Marasmius tenuissimus]
MSAFPFNASLLHSFILLTLPTLLVTAFHVDTPLPATMTINQPYTFTWHLDSADSLPLKLWPKLWGSSPVYTVADLGHTSTILSDTSGVLTLSPSKTGEAYFFCDIVYGTEGARGSDMCRGDVIRVVQTGPSPEPPPGTTVAATLPPLTPVSTSTSTFSEASRASAGTPSVTQNSQQTDLLDLFSSSAANSSASRTPTITHSDTSSVSIINSRNTTVTQINTTTAVPATNTIVAGAKAGPSLTPAIIGGIIGGVVALIILTAIILIIFLRRSRHKRHGQKTIRHDPGPSSEYSYGSSTSSSSVTSLVVPFREVKSASTYSIGLSDQSPRNRPSLITQTATCYDSGGDEKRQLDAATHYNSLEPSSSVNTNPEPRRLIDENHNNRGQLESSEYGLPMSADVTAGTAIDPATRNTVNDTNPLEHGHLLTRLELMAQHITWLEAGHGSLPPQYSQS